MSRVTITFILFLFTIPLIFPFLREGYFDTHDGQWAVIRLTEMHREIKDLQIPPRWAGFLNHNYGYPLFLFTYPFPYYVGEIFHLVGFGFVDSIKLVFILSTILSGISMFFLARRWWGDWGGILASIFYLYAPFRLVDLFVRGSIGESLAFVFFPLLFLFGENIITKQSKKSVVLFSFSLAGLFLTHNVFALLFMPVLVSYLIFFVFISRKKLQSFFAIAAGFLGGLGMSAYFWLPALMEQKYTVLSTGILSKFSRFVPALQLFSVFPPQTDLPIYIGLIHVLGFFGGILAVLFSKEKKLLREMKMLGVIIVIMVILMMPMSEFFWEKMPLFSSVDFSWRILGPLSFVLSLIAGGMAKTKTRFFIVSVALLILLFSSKSLLVPKEFINRGDQFYETNDATTTAFDELMPIWVHDFPRNAFDEKVIVDSGGGVINVYDNRSHRISFSADIYNESIVSVNTIYFPGWKVYLDEKEIEPAVHPVKGIIQIPLQKGKHEVNMKFSNTKLRTIADGISIISFLLLTVLFVSSIKLTNKHAIACLFVKFK